MVSTTAPAPPDPSNTTGAATSEPAGAAIAADVTTLLERWNAGDDEAFDRLVPLVYDQLRRVAARLMASERRGHTLDTTALVHEAYLELGRQNRMQWQGRSHFFGVAAKLMRRITVMHARKLSAQKRGGDQARVTFDESLAMSEQRATELIAIDRALDGLAREAPPLAEVVEARFFVGMTVEETAEALGRSPSTIKREWRLARAYLIDQLGRAAEGL